MGFTIEFVTNFLHAIWMTTPLLLLFAVLIIILGQIVGHIEKWSAFDSFYWAFITAFTVGYGDMRPTSRASKVISIFIALLGIMLAGVIVALTVATATSAFEHKIDLAG